MTKPSHSRIPQDIVPPDFVDIGDADGLLVDLRYASTNNFVGRAIYGDFDRLSLHPIAAAKLKNAVALLTTERPDLRLLVWDGFRPNRVQRIFWAMVRGTEQQRSVSDPAVGSIHSFGFALDLTLAGQDGRELDMGTGFDDFLPLAEPRLEPAFLATGALTAAQVGNRLVLRAVMERAGFSHLPIEWWHFDALPAEQVRTQYRLIE